MIRQSSFFWFLTQLKIFHYIVDETIKVNEEFLATRQTDRILIGKRTGFAFYRDARLDRKILIGVFEGSARVNNYFDGPFDQLPDNFIEGEVLQKALSEAYPDVAGKIDRFGHYADGSRVAISPYTYYRNEEDLLPFHTCATDTAIPADYYYACFVMDLGRNGTPPGLWAYKLLEPAQREHTDQISKRPHKSLAANNSNSETSRRWKLVAHYRR
jgi:hypothetical protein